MNFREVSNVFQRSFKGVPRKMLGYFKEVSRVFEDSFKGVSKGKKFNGCLWDV